jgi:hypothetical protein
MSSRNNSKGKRIKARGIVTKTRRKTSKKILNKQDQGLTIKRSSGRKEKFNTDRMAQTVGRSGVPFMMARDIAKKVTKKIKKGSYGPQQRASKRRTRRQKVIAEKDKVFTAGRIRNLVAGELRDRNRPDIAGSYSGKTPDKPMKQGYDDLEHKQPGIDKFSVNTQHSRRKEVVHDQSKRGGGIMT